MRRSIEWVEKLDGGVKRTVRASFPGKGQVKWEFARSDQEGWDPDATPDLDDWDTLEEKLAGLYNRRRVPYETLELVRRLKSREGA